MVLRRLRRLSLNGLLVVASLALTALAAEGVLRLFPQLTSEEAALRLHWRRLSTIDEDGGARTVLPDDEIGFLYRPHARGRITRADVTGEPFSFAFTTDRLGFRNPDLPEDGADIVVVGDSMVFGYGVADDEGWVALLDRALPDARVVNLGLINAGPQQYQRIYARFGRAFGPRLVILMLFPGNDPTDDLRFTTWLEAGRPAAYGTWRPPGKGEAGLLAWARARAQDSYLASTLQAARRALRSHYHGYTHEFPDGRRVRLAPAAYLGNADLARPDSPVFPTSIQAVMALRDMARADGADFLVAVLPTKEEVYLPLLGKPVPDLVGPFVRELEARGVRPLDLTPALQARALDEPLYFEVDGHPNAAGYAVIAEAVRWALEERGAREEPSS
jgi:lysophospholipase L1-like esterase